MKRSRRRNGRKRREKKQRGADKKRIAEERANRADEWMKEAK